MRSTSIGVEYLEMRELGFSSPTSTSSLQRLYTLGENSRKAPTTSPWSGVRAMALAHGPDSSWPDCVVVLEVDLASVAHPPVAWD